MPRPEGSALLKGPANSYRQGGARIPDPDADAGLIYLNFGRFPAILDPCMHGWPHGMISDWER
jgi:hypothetical protein